MSDYTQQLTDDSPHASVLVGKLQGHRRCLPHLLHSPKVQSREAILIAPRYLNLFNEPSEVWQMNFIHLLHLVDINVFHSGACMFPTEPKASPAEFLSKP